MSVVSHYSERVNEHGGESPAQSVQYTRKVIPKISVGGDKVAQ